MFGGSPGEAVRRRSGLAHSVWVFCRSQAGPQRCGRTVVAALVVVSVVLFLLRPPVFRPPPVPYFLVEGPRDPDCLANNRGPFPRMPHVDVAVSAFDEDVRWLAMLALDVHSVSLYVHTDGDAEQVRTHCCTTRGCDMSKCPQMKASAGHKKLLETASDLAAASSRVYAHYIPNRGDEAAAFYQHIVSHYDSLAPYTAFIHGHRDAYHSRDMLDVLRHMCLPADAQFANLNEWPDGRSHLVQCYSAHPSSVHKSKVHSDLVHRHSAVAALEAEVLGIEGPPRYVLAHAYAQFIVSKAAIRRHPVRVYESLRDRALATGDGFEHEYYWRRLFVGGVDPAGDAAIAARRC